MLLFVREIKQKDTKVTKITKKSKEAKHGDNEAQREKVRNLI
jgi:hypothetical protein